MLRVGVVGVGHLGQHHARVYTELLDARLVGVADSDLDRAKTIGDHLGVQAYSSIEELINFQRPEALSIVVPTSQHFEVAKKAMQAGIHVLIEKPVTTRPDEAEELLKLADKQGLVLQVGHIERFNSAIRYISQTHHEPIYLESKRMGPFSPRINDVGVVLDLMIHDIDIILSLVNSPIAKISAAGACVYTEHEDIADAQIRFENGVIAHIVVSRVAEKNLRQLDIMEKQRHITVNYETQSVQVSRCVTSNDGRAEILETPIFPKSEPLKLELAHFVSCVKDKRQPLVGIKDGKRALEIAVEVLRQIHGNNYNNLNNLNLNIA
ncbi:MAG: Gfo/Idh/MocA family oxidoreductase [Synergistaceae bacterium]|nr:Gfo/Idh/MocA family oxidoreductase [Synergistaceae bacterium]MBR0043988.1 Gfo/Idh/MocA family oxidoreductase [Synergistaceae bacterium]